MKKLFFLLVLSSIVFVSVASSHPGDDIRISWCHVCRTNCSDYWLIYWEFHCHELTLEDEISAIQSYYSANWFGRSSAATSAIEQATIRFNNQIIPVVSPSYIIPTYVPNSQSNDDMIYNYDRLIEYLQAASYYYENNDHVNVISNLEKALPYAKNISKNEEDNINLLIEEAKERQSINEFSIAMDYCEDKYWDKAYWFNQWDEINCDCVQGYTKNDLLSVCIPETNNLITPEEELWIAINRMYSKWLTIYNTQQTFMSDQNLTRQQASKFFAEFAEKVAGLFANTSLSPDFNDTVNADSTLKPYIIKSYQMGIFLWNNWKFLPFDKLTKAEALTVLSRIIFWETYNKWRSTWYAWHFNIAEMSWVLTNLDFSLQSVEKDFLTRWEAALLIYRYYNIYSE